MPASENGLQSPFLCHWKELCASGDLHLIIQMPNVLLEGSALFQMNMNLLYHQKRRRKWGDQAPDDTHDLRKICTFRPCVKCVIFLPGDVFFVCVTCASKHVYACEASSREDHAGFVMLWEWRHCKQLRGVTGLTQATGQQEELGEAHWTAR